MFYLYKFNIMEGTSLCPDLEAVILIVSLICPAISDIGFGNTNQGLILRPRKARTYIAPKESRPDFPLGPRFMWGWCKLGFSSYIYLLFEYMISINRQIVSDKLYIRVPPLVRAHRTSIF